jgi:hypothetical protein
MNVCEKEDYKLQGNEADIGWIQRSHTVRVAQPYMGSRK